MEEVKKPFLIRLVPGIGGDPLNHEQVSALAELFSGRRELTPDDVERFLAQGGPYKDGNFLILDLGHFAQITARVFGNRATVI